MKYIVLLAIILAFAMSQDEDPMWNNRWCEDFTEQFTYGWLGPYTTSGKMCYDWDLKQYAVYRDNGHWDRYCGFDWYHIWFASPCTHYVKNATRYLHYPKENYCCTCCYAEDGCDVLKPNWLEGAEFIGEVTFEGQTAYKWDKAGLQSNFYYETAEFSPKDRIMLGIDQQPNDFQMFDSSTYTTNFDQGLLDLPDGCEGSSTCSIGICTAVRNA